MFKHIGKLIGAFVLMMLLSTNSHAQYVAALGDQNSSNVYRVTIDTSGVFQFASDTGIVYPYKVLATTDTIAVTDSGRTFTVSPTATAGILTLPPANPGMEFTFIANTNVVFDVNPYGSETILWAPSSQPMSAGDQIGCPCVTGDSLQLFSTAAGTWSVKEMRGAWTDDN